MRSARLIAFALTAGWRISPTARTAPNSRVRAASARWQARQADAPRAGDSKAPLPTVGMSGRRACRDRLAAERPRQPAEVHIDLRKTGFDLLDLCFDRSDGGEGIVLD